jgi:hypothetical protein
VQIVGTNLNTHHLQHDRLGTVLSKATRHDTPSRRPPCPVSRPCATPPT